MSDDAMGHDPGSHDRALRIEDLNFAAQLVVWSGRRWVSDRNGWAAVEAEFCGPLGSETGLALADSLDRLFATVAASASRPVTLGPLSCHRAWPDEIGLISAVACLQNGDTPLASDFFSRFLRPAGVRSALTLAGEVARILCEADYIIGPAHREAAPVTAAAGPGVPAGATIH
ncbi:MAG: hypothetical protein RLT05_01545 [Bauldia litoralis]